MPLLKAEVGGALVAEEVVAVANEELVDADHGGFGRRLVALDFRRGNRVAKPCASRKGAIQSKPHSSGRTTRFSSRVVSRVSQLYIQRAYHACIMNSDSILAVANGAEPGDGSAGLIAGRAAPPAYASTPPRIQPTLSSSMIAMMRLRDNAVEAPHLEHVLLNHGEPEREAEAARRRPAERKPRDAATPGRQ